VAQFFQRGSGLAFLHRLVVAFHLVCLEVGACGIRLACLFLIIRALQLIPRFDDALRHISS
jgi:hypothetical protein